MRHPLLSKALLLVALGVCAPRGEAAQGERLSSALLRAGANRAQLEQALAGVAPEQRTALQWLIERMPPGDLETLSAQYLIENCALAFCAWREAPWQAEVPEELFLDALMPYACVNERRDAWRGDFRQRFAPLVKDAPTAGAAAALLNNAIFRELGVKYSTGRSKADQSPYETIASGLASCTGLSILLIDACRAVGVPARFVGTPLWTDGSGNHSWVEIWDKGWHFTGAAEATGSALDQAWFAGRAATAQPGHPEHAILAATWRDSPLHFPLVWSPQDRSVRALDVTERYLACAPAVPVGSARVRFRVAQQGVRREGRVSVTDEHGALLFEGRSKDERFDANDHLTALLPLGAQLFVALDGVAAVTLEVVRDEQLVELGEQQPQAVEPAPALAQLELHLARHGLAGIDQQPFALVPLSKAQAETAATRLWAAHVEQLRAERSAELAARVLELEGARMPFWYTLFGDKPARGRSLWISMHGGGGAPTEVNDQQWRNQQQLYTLDEGVYLAPRAPTDTWNLWHEGRIDALFARLIEDLIVLEDVDPDRVYLLGYSAGGDGVYQLAPRMADRFAAAGMMAGHPNETRPDGLRNLGFALHVGALDGAYNRNGIALEWQAALDLLEAQDPGAYAHQVVVHAGKGHWMDGEEREALPWMAKFTREPNPSKLVWLQDDVLHARFYWLAVDVPQAGACLVAERTGQRIEITGAARQGTLRVRLSDALLDLDQAVHVLLDGQSAFEGRVTRTIGCLARTLAERGDPRAMYCAEVVTQVEPSGR